MSEFAPRDLAAAGGLAAGEIHLWAIDLDPPPAAYGRLALHLSADERQRAARFRFAPHRRRYTAGRGSLRILLGRYLDLAPGEVQFDYGRRGKPSLAKVPQSSGELFFNLSNSHELALAAFVRGVEVGVDVEHLRPVRNLRELAARFFAPSEAAALQELPEADQVRGFFNCWTRKEAYLKAVGEGLAARLDSFAVTLRPGDTPKMLSLEGDAERAAKWWLAVAEPEKGYVSALAVEAPQLQIHTFRLHSC